MKVLRTIGTLTIGAAAGFMACGVLTVRGVLKSERHRKALADTVAEKLTEGLFVERASTSRVSYYRPYTKYRSYSEKTPRSKVSYKNYNVKKCPMMNESRGPVDIIFENGTEAEATFNTIKDLIKEYGYVTVADVCDMCELYSNYTDTKYGWTHVSDMYIDPTNDYELHLPKPLPLK